MSSKEQILKMLEGRIDKMQNLAIEGIELIWQAAWNAAIEDAAKLGETSKGYPTEVSENIRSLKK